MQSVYTIPAILSTILNPRAPTFNVTPKGETLSRDFISPLATPFYVLALINLGTVGAGVYRMFQVQDRNDIYPIAITLFWGFVNSIMLLATMGALLERRQRRSTPRMPSLIPASLLIDENEFPCRVTDLSLGGCKMVFKGVPERTFHKPGQTRLKIEIGEERQGERFLNLNLRNLRLDDETGEITVGADFAHRSLEETRDKVRLVAGNKQRWVEFQKRRESRLSVLGCFISFTYLGLKTSAYHFSHLITHAGDSVTGRSRASETQSCENL